MKEKPSADTLLRQRVLGLKPGRPRVLHIPLDASDDGAVQPKPTPAQLRRHRAALREAIEAGAQVASLDK